MHHRDQGEEREDFVPSAAGRARAGPVGRSFYLRSQSVLPLHEGRAAGAAAGAGPGAGGGWIGVSMRAGSALDLSRRMERMERMEGAGLGQGSGSPDGEYSDFRTPRFWVQGKEQLDHLEKSIRSVRAMDQEVTPSYGGFVSRGGMMLDRSVRSQQDLSLSHTMERNHSAFFPATAAGGGGGSSGSSSGSGREHGALDMSVNHPFKSPDMNALNASRRIHTSMDALAPPVMAVHADRGEREDRRGRSVDTWEAAHYSHHPHDDGHTAMMGRHHHHQHHQHHRPAANMLQSRDPYASQYSPRGEGGGCD